MQSHRKSFPQRALSTLQRACKRLWRQSRANRLGIHEGAQNCLYLNRFTPQSVVIDVGCADDADLSMYLISRFGVKSYGIDPTHKHTGALEQLAKHSSGRFVHVPIAVSDVSGQLTFHESVQNVSGSLCADHSNVVNDQIRSYTVEALTLDDLLQRLGLERADFLKLDLEGIEYNLLSKVGASTLQKFDQIFIEFHHHCISQHTQAHTNQLVDKIKGFGYEAFSFDDHNYLFFMA